MSDWPFEPPISPMEARVRERLLEPPGWLFVGLAPGADRVTGRARRPHGPSGSMPSSPAPYRSVIIVADAADWQRRRERNGAVQSADRPGHAMLPPSGGAVPKPLRNAPAGVGARDPRDQRGHRASVPQAALSRGGPSKLAVAARAMTSGVSKPAQPRGQPEDSALREFFGDQTRRLLARALTIPATPRGGAGRRVTILDLVEAGLLPPDAALEANVRGVSHAARVRDGMIDLDGRQFASPSAASRALRGTESWNGWVDWRHKGERLADLRDRFRSAARREQLRKS